LYKEDRINFSELDYALRRRNMKTMITQLIDNTGLRDKATKQYIYILYMTRAVKTEHLHELLDKVMEN